VRPLDETQDFKPLPPGVWRRSTDPDTLEQDADDGMRSYVRAPELSETVTQDTPPAKPPA
jgi:hypothetical protein